MQNPRRMMSEFSQIPRENGIEDFCTLEAETVTVDPPDTTSLPTVRPIIPSLDRLMQAATVVFQTEFRVHPLNPVPLGGSARPAAFGTAG
jgi:hypothetical protein